jgi:enamine deaminase RidA (YjgF/YER057c/UK114 family)
MTRDLVRKEGLFVGGSGGAAVAGAVKWAKQQRGPLKILVFLCDSGTKYVSKIFNDDWMRENGFLEEDWAVGTIAELMRAMPRRDVVTVDVADPLSKAVTLFKERGFSQVPVTDHGKLAARAVAIDLMGTLHAAVGDLNKVKRIVKVMSLVNSTADFTEQHLVTNGCSELLGQVFGDVGVHARSAFGVAQLPMGACVEIELIAEIA